VVCVRCVCLVCLSLYVHVSKYVFPLWCL